MLITDQLEQTYYKYHQIQRLNHHTHNWFMTRLLNQKETLWTPNIKWLLWDLIFKKVCLRTCSFLPRKITSIIRELNPGVSLILSLRSRAPPHPALGHVYTFAVLKFIFAMPCFQAQAVEDPLIPWKDLLGPWSNDRLNRGQEQEVHAGHWCVILQGNGQWRTAA